MANITHPAMRKSTPLSTTEASRQPNSLVVDDLSSFGGAPAQTQVEQVSVPEPQALDPLIRKRVEDILFVGRTTTTVALAGHTFELSTLTAREHKVLMGELQKIREEMDLLDIRAYTMASVLRTIDGVSLEDLSAECVGESGFLRKVELVDGMQLKVIERLYDEYSKLANSAEQLITSETIKK